MPDYSAFYRLEQFVEDYAKEKMSRRSFTLTAKSDGTINIYNPDSESSLTFSREDIVWLQDQLEKLTPFLRIKADKPKSQPYFDDGGK